LQRRVGVTVLLVTHDQIEALSVSDRIAVMRQGRLEQLGSPQDLYWTPGTPSVRDFLGHTILLEGQVESVTDVSATVSLGSGVTVVCRGVSLDAEAPAGAACRLAVRPELVQVHADASLDGPNRIGGRITALLFVGDRYEATVALDIGQDAFVYLPAAQPWRDDQRVSLEIRPDDVRMWAA
jgi:ABC-type Fe3+/spermidine/putrescine transport system ATPase subunit